MDAYSINRRLIKLHGRDTLLDLPNWRVVRAETQTEKRRGNYNIFYGDIFLRNETGIVETRKYHYIKPCWVLEKLFAINDPLNFNLIGEKSHTYEIIFTFLSKDDVALPLTWRPIELVIHGYNQAKNFKTEKDHLEEEANKIIKEQNRVKEVLFGDDTDVSDALRYREGVVVPSNYKSEKRDKSGIQLA